MKPSTSSKQSFQAFPLLAILMPTTCILALAACSQHPSPSAAETVPTASTSSFAPAKTTSTPSDVQVFFDSGSSSLSAEANQKLDEAARLYREGHPAVMFVTGHADSVGGEYPNLVLSGQRAQATKEALVARGIPADRLQLQAMGSSLPRDAKQAPPTENRRVVITWR